MFSDKQVAVTVRDDVMAAIGCLESSISKISDKCSSDELVQYKRLVGAVMHEAIFGILIKIFDSFPDIRPEEYKLSLP